MIKILKYFFGSLYFVWRAIEIALVFVMLMFVIVGLPMLVGYIISYFTDSGFTGFIGWSMICFIAWSSYLNSRKD